MSSDKGPNQLEKKTEDGSKETLREKISGFKEIAKEKIKNKSSEIYDNTAEAREHAKIIAQEKLETGKLFIEDKLKQVHERSIELYNNPDESKELLKFIIKEKYELSKEIVNDKADKIQEKGNEMYNKGVEAYENNFFVQTWKYRNRIISDYSFKVRQNTILGLNIPIFFLSKGLSRIKNPLVFTACASVLFLPEVINPFKGR